MGGRNGKQDNFQRMLTDMRRQPQGRVTVHPQKKYFNLMLEQLLKSKLPAALKAAAAQTLHEKLTEMELIECITSINALRNNDFQVNLNRTIIKDKPESSQVLVNFGQNFVAKIFKKIRNNVLLTESTNTKDTTESHTQDPSLTRKHKLLKIDESELKQKLKNISLVMRKELNRISHPFGKLNKAFAQYIEEYCRSQLPKDMAQERYEKSLKMLVTDWCAYLEISCLQPYRKWIISYTGLEPAKFSRWIRNLIMQQIWANNNGYLFSMLSAVIHTRKVPLKINYKLLQTAQARLTPSLFSIDQKLQIQGHFFDSIYEMSQVVGRLRPQQIMDQLQTVKKRICTDIDNYHRLLQRGQIYQIDSDNILGIVGYILCKISSKIDQIHTHLIFLRIVYGDQVYYNMGVGSYILSTIFGALEFLESSHFQELAGGHQNKEKIQQGGSQISKQAEKITLDLKGQKTIAQTISHREQGQQRGEVGDDSMHVSSLVLQN